MPLPMTHLGMDGEYDDDWREHAIAILKQHPSWSTAAIAAEVGVHRLTLGGFPRFQQLRAQLRRGELPADG